MPKEKKSVKKKVATPKKKVATKKAAKPKTMAARRLPTTLTPAIPQVRKSIVSAILATKKKTFTSTDIATASRASARHSRRTLSNLAKQRVLVVEKGRAPFQYRVANREKLRETFYQV